MTGFEQAFEGAEQAADAAVAAAGGLVKLARRAQKAAQQGRIADVKRAQQEIETALGEVRRAVADVAASWPFADADEESHLRDHYARELRSAAEAVGLDIYEQDGRLIAHPSIVRILPARRAITIGGKRVSAIRPAHVARLLLENRSKPSRHRSDTFLESLYRVYADIEEGRLGRVVPLARIYRLLTSLPGAAREYDKTDFGRDLYLLDANGPRCTKKGAAVSFPASSGTRGRSGLFSFVGPDGQEVRYYSIRFTQGA